MVILDDSQQQAVANIAAGTQNLYLLIGGAGAGKTTTIRHLLERLWEDEYSEIEPENTYLAAPTGKAAKVIRDSFKGEGFEVFNEPATIHRMLEYKPGYGWGYNQTRPLNASLVVLDEASMVDSLLLATVVRALPPDCRLVLVGDEHQLPPVAAGQPFTDIRTYGAKDTVNRLTKNHRQQQGSLIANGCLEILGGQLPTFGRPGERTLGGELYDDLFFHETDDKEDIPVLVGDLCEEWHREGLDYAVLAPQRTGVCGVEKMNAYLQERLNPFIGQGEYRLGWCVLRVGDKVLQTRNNYDLNVFNGFCGIVRAIEGDEILVDFDGQLVEYDSKDDIKDLALGYCMTIHKAQGSQFKLGILICHSSHYYMQNRSLTYTGFSRFKKLLHVVGDKKALKRGVTNVVSGERNTYLKLQMGGEA